MIKRLMTMLMIVFLVTFLIGSMQAKAEMTPLSSELYQYAYAELLPTGKVAFSAAIRHRATIAVNSCILQKKEGSNWVFDQSLSCPPSTSNATRYSKNMDYSAKLTSGTTYRIVAVFAADGETRTAMSDGITY